MCFFNFFEIFSKLNLQDSYSILTVLFNFVLLLQTMYSRFHNIGEVNENQVIFKDGKLQLYYTNGDDCPTVQHQKFSTRIILNCDQNAIVS